MRWLLGAPLTGQGELELEASGLQLVGIAVGLLAVLALALWSGRRGRGSPVWEAVLLAVGLISAGFAMAQPTWVERAGRTEPGVLAILIDDSQSMSVLEDGRPRSVAVEQALAQAKVGRTEVYTFGSQIGVGEITSYQQAGSDLGGALRALEDRYAGERLAGIVVISDGLDRGGLRQSVMSSESPKPLGLPGPLTVYQVGDAQELNDLAVLEIDSGGYAFQDAPFTITGRIQGAGYAGRSVPAILLEDGDEVAAQMLTLDASGQAEVSFEVERERPGRHIYEIKVPTWEGDAVPGNNSLPVAVNVVRDKIRVLQVCGGPSFDEKFLRLFLKQDPAVDLVSFFILRTPDDVNASEYRSQELSLIEFPYISLFTREDRDGELDTFDLVIFQDFDYAPYFAREQADLLGEIADYVRDGGAFVMLGGERSFDKGAYDGTPLADILPVKLGLEAEKSTDLERFTPTLTPEGQKHPVTRLLGQGEENALLWERLPPLDGLNLSAGLARESAALLVHPSQTTADGDPMPVLAVREVGEGRTMALMGDSSWRWVMSEAAAGNGNQAYLRFWKNSMRWLMQDRDGQRVRVDATRDNLGVGEPVRLVTRVRDVGFEAMEGVPVRGTVQGPGGIESFEGTTNAAGEAVIELETSGSGSFLVEVEAGKPGAALGKDSTSFAVSARDPELDEILPDAAFLKTLAALEQGRYYGPGDYGAPIVDPEAGRVVDEEKRTPLWSAPILALLAGLGLGGSWLLRRRRGLR